MTSNKFDMIEKECKNGETYEFMYKNFAYDSNIYLVSWATFTGSNPIKEQFGQIEFEYWVINEESYAKLWKVGFIYSLASGVVLCILILIVYKSGISEQLTNDVKLRIWKLRGKTKDYVKENAPSVLEMVDE
jgi:hypothetical protein